MAKVLEKLKLGFVPGKYNQFQPLILRQRSLLFYTLGLIILKIVILALIFYFPKTDFFAAINAQNLVSLINQERGARDLTPLRLSEQLNQAAGLKAQDMIANNYFDHWSPAGISPWYWLAKAGYNFVWAGENLAMHFFDTEAVFDAWMKSPSHRDNILSPEYQELGVAVMSGEIQGKETTVSVLTFGSPKITKKAEMGFPVSPQKPVSKPAELTKPEEQPKNELAILEQETKPTSSQKGEEKTVNLVQVPNTPLTQSKKILGVATINFVELGRNLYLYFSLFLIIALAINILVKISIQHVPTIVLTLILIGASISLTFI